MLAENSSLLLLKILYWEFFIVLAENSSLLLLKILYWEFFIALTENSSLLLLKILYWEFFIALAENSSLLLLKILYWEFFTASQKVGQCCDISDADNGSNLRVVLRVANSCLQTGGLCHQIWRVLASRQISVVHYLSEFTPNLTSNLCPVEFDRSNWE